MRGITNILLLLLSSLANGLRPLPATAATIWSGPRRTFTKANYAGWTNAPNQDRITPNVWLTRENTAGLFNIAMESGSDNSSPVNTEWAYGSTSYLPATFKTWYAWNGYDPQSSTGQAAVVHLIAENIYIDIKFTSFTGSGGGGGFTYERAGYVYLSLKGSQKTAISRYGSFTDPGATASNSAGETLSVTINGSIDTNAPGDYLLTYSATDTLGFATTTNRLVSVLETNQAPSWWLAQYNLGTNIMDSLLDSDADGLPNWAEYRAGTNPTNALSVFRVSAITANGLLQWPSVSGRVYSVYRTTDLSTPFSIAPGGSNLPAGPPGNTFTNTELPLPSTQFFKLDVRLNE